MKSDIQLYPDFIKALKENDIVYLFGAVLKPTSRILRKNKAVLPIDIVIYTIVSISNEIIKTDPTTLFKVIAKIIFNVTIPPVTTIKIVNGIIKTPYQ